MSQFNATLLSVFAIGSISVCGTAIWAIIVTTKAELKRIEEEKRKEH